MIYLLSERKIILLIYPIFYSIIYIFNFKNFEQYYFNPDKLRGFVGLTYSVENIILSSFQFFLILLGLIFIFKNGNINFKIPKFINNLCSTTVIFISFGSVRVTNTNFKFLNFYLFGHNKRGTTENNLLLFDIYTNKVAWRGLFPSAETIGEFF